MLSIYVLTWLGVIAAQISPGPNLAAVASVGLAQGRRPALFVVVGILSGMLVWSTATALGLGALIETYPVSLLLMKFLGGGYLLLLGVKSAWKTFRGGGNAIFAPDARPLKKCDCLSSGRFGPTHQSQSCTYVGRGRIFPFWSRIERVARPRIWTNGCVVRLDYLRNSRVSVFNWDRYARLLSFFALI